MVRIKDVIKEEVKLCSSVLKTFFLFCCILLLPLKIFTQTAGDILYQCYESDYEEARHLLEISEINDKARFYLSTYISQNLNIPLKNLEKNFCDSASIERLPMNFLICGDKEFYSGMRNYVALELYKKAYHLGLEIRDTLIPKIALKSILEVISTHDNMQDSEPFLDYIQDFKNISNSDLDKGWITLYDFRSKERKNNQINELPESYLDQTKLLIERSKNDNLKGIFYSYLVSYYSHNKVDDDSVLKYANMGISLLKKNPNMIHSERISSIYNNLGAFYVNKEMPEKALEYLDIPVPEFQGYLRKFSDSYRYYRKYMAHSALNSDSINEMNIKYLEAEIALNDLESIALINDADIKYKTAEKEKQILIEQQRARTNRNWLIAAALALLLGSGVAVLLQKNTTKKRQLAEQTTLLEQQKVETLLKEQELVSIDAMIAGQEKERQKVANELHDDLGSLMATVKLHFDNVKVDQKDPALKSAQDLLEKAYQKIRGMAHAKNSGVMANQGLLPAVQKIARTINETNALEVTVEDFGLADRMENSLELTIFRILQELMANIIKHAQATKTSIQFTQHEDKLNIIVEDNGKGFDMSNIARSSNGMGLTTIEKRIEHLEGTFTVDSVLGKGTSILIDIPL